MCDSCCSGKKDAPQRSADYKREHFIKYKDVSKPPLEPEVAKKIVNEAWERTKNDPSPLSKEMLAYNSTCAALKAHLTLPNVTIPGLIYLPEYITVDEEEYIVRNILDANPYCYDIARRTQMYGYTYYHTRHNLPTMQPTAQPADHGSNSGATSQEQEEKINNEQQQQQEQQKPKDDGTILPMDPFNFLCDRMAIRDHLFDKDVEHYPTQVLVNEYRGQMGISHHVDNVNAFGDIIALVSLVDPIYMTLKRVESNAQQEPLEVKILLEPRSLLVMKDDSRFEWTHGITKMKHLPVPGKENVVRDDKYRRLSLTVRVIKTQGTKKVNQETPKPLDCFW